MWKCNSIAIAFCMVISVQVSLCSLLPIPEINRTMCAETLLELHRQVCPAHKYPNLVILPHSNEELVDTVLLRIISDDSYTYIVSAFPIYLTSANQFYSCMLMLIDSLDDFKMVESVEDGVKLIYFYPRRMHAMVQNVPIQSVQRAIRIGYEVVYGSGVSVDIYRKNWFSNQTTKLDPRITGVPDETRDMHGYKIFMYNNEFTRKVLSFEAYFVEQVANKRNASVIQTAEMSNRLDYMPVIAIEGLSAELLIPAFGTVFKGVFVPRAKLKPIVSILIDPFDAYVWLTYLLLVFVMTVTISMFGKILGKLHFVEIALELVMICLAGPSRPYGGVFENHIITLFCVMGIVLMSSYQSLVISFMSYVRYEPEINTLAEIHERCLFPDNRFASIFNFKTFPNGTRPGLGKECLMIAARDNEKQTALVNSYVYSDKDVQVRKNYLHYLVKNYRLAETKFFEYLFCFGVVPMLQELFLFYSQAVFESGIYEYYYNNKTRAVWQYEHKTFVDEEVRVRDMLLLWYAYSGGMLLSILCFVLETVVKKEFK
uniref:Ionotropic glutamate receptor C-terminal domain-containing protein n=1 Tax=Anopheles coluzzii TaxID=1518534 RepID=A0A6E8WA02_ANOCL